MTKWWNKYMLHEEEHICGCSEYFEGLCPKYLKDPNKFRDLSKKIRYLSKLTRRGRGAATRVSGHSEAGSWKSSPIIKFPLLKRRGGHPPNPLWFCPPSGTKAGWNLATTVAWKCPRPTNANMIKTSHWMRKLKWKHHRLVQDTQLTVRVAVQSGTNLASTGHLISCDNLFKN